MNLKRTNFLLALITLCLMTNILIQLEIWPTKVNANGLSLDPTINYGIVPLNTDGSINVNLNSSNNIIDVNIEAINGYKDVFYKKNGRFFLLPTTNNISAE